jgi:hypothetical protein
MNTPPSAGEMQKEEEEGREGALQSLPKWLNCLCRAGDVPGEAKGSELMGGRSDGEAREWGVKETYVNQFCRVVRVMTERVSRHL